MDRRDFLKFSGVGLGGVLLSSLPAQALAQGFQGSEEQFKLLTAPSLNLDVFINERKFGSIPGNAFSPFVKSLSSSNVIESCLSSVCGSELNAGEEKPDEAPYSLWDYLSPMPYGLLPLLAHPISAIQDVESRYAVVGNIALLPDIEVPPDYFPKAPLQIPGVLPDAGIGGKIGRYYYRVSLEKGYIGGCIRRRVWHAGAMVKYQRSKRPFFDLHIAGWWHGGRPCFGVYESHSRWCRKWCTWNAWRVIYVLTLSVATLYVSYWVASALAAAIASSAVGVLIAIPGVPPPP